MYNNNPNPGYFKPPKLTKNFAEQVIRSIVDPNHAVNIDFKKIEVTDNTNTWHHSCVAVGVAPLVPQILPHQDGAIAFIFCNHCNRVVYAIDKT